MLYAWIDGEKRPPRTRGERTVCACKAELQAVIPVENLRHWRHKGGDCDPWSEGETQWHLDWKEAFDPAWREVMLVDPATGERHRADVRVDGRAGGLATVLELQHSPISENERTAREVFYSREHRMFWLLHLHDEHSNRGTSFRLSLDLIGRKVEYAGRTFTVLHWVGDNQFIEKWKCSRAHVFFDYRGAIFFLAGSNLSDRLGGPFLRGEFAFCQLTRAAFVRAVYGRH